MSNMPPDALDFFAQTGLPGTPRGFDGFGDSPELMDELLDLVLHGPKRATCSLARWFENDPDGLPKPGDLWVIHDGAKRPRAVIRTTSVEVKPVHQADAQFAWDEGEGDRSFEWWLDAHEAYWRREAERHGFTYSRDLDAVFERFELAWPEAG